MVDIKKKIRKSPEARKQEIIEASVKLISERGFNGISLRDVADAVGISQPGLLHYVGNKDGLLSLLITDIYDMTGTPSDFMKSGLPGSDPEGMHFPAYLRFLVRHNAHRRQMVQLYMVLETESFNIDHPLHKYFEHRPEEVWKHYSQYSWKLPPGMQWDVHMRPFVRKSIEAMDGIQLRWLRQPPIDFYDEWVDFERILFPSPQWDGYK
ncbi:AcrR family transcriptional regulator [Galliscardovia ingluviei]|uniref:AcrR family transcriptional regulator n=1 Tax=Galliscardovia ingluviei TaxID=1769422 RepID=A0A8J3AQK7_9BIFI|nr:TetR/AcrR family transcriptional regulator [Galliscardovia ingluviei]GGI15077.1 AcrR family transcriptional regulator [Galliscardovia ingluviei]